MKHRMRTFALLCALFFGMAVTGCGKEEKKSIVIVCENDVSVDVSVAEDSDLSLNNAKDNAFTVSSDAGTAYGKIVDASDYSTVSAKHYSDNDATTVSINGGNGLAFTSDSEDPTFKKNCPRTHMFAAGNSGKYVVLNASDDNILYNAEEYMTIKVSGGAKS